MKHQAEKWDARDFRSTVSFRPDEALAEALAATANRYRSPDKTTLISSLLESALSQGVGSDEKQAMILRLLQDNDRDAEARSGELETVVEQLGEITAELASWSAIGERVSELSAQLESLKRIRGEVAAAMAVLLCTSKDTPMDEAKARKIVERIFPITLAENS